MVNLNYYLTISMTKNNSTRALVYGVILALLCGAAFTTTIMLTQSNTTDAASRVVQNGSLIKLQGSNDIYTVKINFVYAHKRRIPTEIVSPADRARAITVAPRAFYNYRESRLVMEVNSQGQPINGTVYLIQPIPGQYKSYKRPLAFTHQQFQNAGLSWSAVFPITTAELNHAHYILGTPVATSYFAGLPQPYYHPGPATSVWSYPTHRVYTPSFAVATPYVAPTTPVVAPVPAVAPTPAASSTPVVAPTPAASSVPVVAPTPMVAPSTTPSTSTPATTPSTSTPSTTPSSSTDSASASISDPDTAPSSSSGAYYTSKYPTARYYYPEDCSGWRGLSVSNRVRFTSLDRLLAEYSDRTLSPGCK